MERFRTRGDWATLSTNEVIEWSGNNRAAILLRLEQPGCVYGSDNPGFAEELLLGKGDGQIEIEAFGFGDLYVRVDTEGRCWVQERAGDQTVHKMHEEVFTSLERPPKLSPEMEMIYRMSRQNELMREQVLREAKEIANERREPADEETLEDDASGATEPRQRRSGRREPEESGDAESEHLDAEGQGESDEPPVPSE
jgi:hypothetical protein